ncbi:hypothetical protein [Oryzibacter oryziterrae]|uniref:hypothetical protein n=1 Tax=Oryzibacter oryziterrae TaxID=2766474 RepID=UPI001F247AEC|nr:hypothetical protein [Oryzibacter oryziterrae]
MKSILFSTVLAVAVTLGASNANAFNMHVPKAMVVAAIEGSAVVDTRPTGSLQAFTILKVAGDYASFLRQQVIHVMAPSNFAAIGLAIEKVVGQNHVDSAFTIAI